MISILLKSSFFHILGFRALAPSLLWSGKFAVMIMPYHAHYAHLGFKAVQNSPMINWPKALCFCQCKRIWFCMNTINHASSLKKWWCRLYHYCHFLSIYIYCIHEPKSSRTLQSRLGSGITILRSTEIVDLLKSPGKKNTFNKSRQYASELLNKSYYNCSCSPAPKFVEVLGPPLKKLWNLNTRPSFLVSSPHWFSKSTEKRPLTERNRFWMWSKAFKLTSNLYSHFLNTFICF